MATHSADAASAIDPDRPSGRTAFYLGADYPVPLDELIGPALIPGFLCRRAGCHRAVAVRGKNEPSYSLAPLETETLRGLPAAEATDDVVEHGQAPAQGVEADQHVVADLDVYCSQVKQIEWENPTVVGAGNELRDPLNLAAILYFCESDQARLLFAN